MSISQAGAQSRSLIKRSIKISAALAVIKIVAGLATGSLGVLASALDSVLDITASAVNYFSLDFAQLPPDKTHPYGHGKVEALAGLFQGAFIAASGLALLAESLRRMVSGSELQAASIAIGAMAASMAMSAWHARNLRQDAASSGSTVMKTERAHFAVDVLSNGAVLAALIAAYVTGKSVWDLLISVGVTAYILREAFIILLDCVRELMDHGLSPERLGGVERAIREHHCALVGFHDLRTRKSGGRVFIDCHIELRGVRLFREAHDITESLVDKIETLIPGSDVTIHFDPEGER